MRQHQNITSMVKTTLILLVMMLPALTIAQGWTKHLPQEKKQDLTFFDYQQAFEKHHQNINIKNGKRVGDDGKLYKIPGWNQYQRWAYYWESRVNPTTGAFPNVDLNDFSSKQSADSDKSTTGNWTIIGPDQSDGGYAGIGRLNCVQFHPTNANKMWVGAASGGVWATTDGGNNWTVLNDDSQVLGVSDIVIPSDYETSKTIYIATGDRDGWDTRSVGVLKSTDEGNTWNTTGLSFTVAQGHNTNRLLLHPTNNQTLIAATTNGVYKTTNGGSSWSMLSSHNFIDMEYKPGDFNTLYGSSKYGEIYVSTNGGTSWSPAFSNGERIELAVSPDEPTWVYAVVASSDNGLYGVYRSTNSGASYTQVYDGLAGFQNLLGWDSDASGTSGQGWYDLSLAANPVDANVIYLGGINTWKSSNGGTSWEMVNHWWGDGVQAVHADKHSLHFNPNTGYLFECNDGGIYKSGDGYSWVDLSNTLEISQIYKLGTAKTNATETIVGLQDNGTKLASNGSWFDVKGGDGMECIIDYNDIDVQYGTYVYGEIERTTSHWDFGGTIISDNIPGGNSGAWVTPYIMDPVNSSTLYVGYEDVWKTTNKGDTWTKIGEFFDGTLRSMAISQSNNSYIYIATYSKIQKTTNGGSSWSNITSNLPVGDASIKYITVKDNDPNTIWVAMSGYGGHGVYQSTNGGSSWTNIASGLPNIPCNTIVQNIQNTSEVELYAGTDAGVYVKLGSANWAPYNSGLPNVVIGELEIYYNDANPDNSRLRAGTYGRGLWETELYDNDVVIPTCTTTAFPDCNTGIVRVSSDLSGTQTFYLTDNSGTILNSVTLNSTYQDFNALSDGTYRGKVAKDGQTSELSSPTNLVNYTTPSQPSAITGSSSVCETSTQTYSVSNVSGITYTWSLPAGWSGNSTSNSISVTVGPTSGTISVTPSNSCGNGPSQSMSVTVSNVPGQPSAITGETEICEGTTQTYSVSNVSGVDFNWTLPSGWTGTSTTNSITVTAGSTSGAISVSMANDCGNGPAQTLDVIVNGDPAQPVEIIGESVVCEGTTQTYSVTEVEGMTYEWSIPAGWTGTSTTNSITVTIGTSGGTISVTPSNDCGTGTAQTLDVEIGNLPSQPSPIEGPEEVCEGSYQTFEVTHVDYVTYSWEIPESWSGTSNANMIYLQVGDTGGTITVTPSNGCGNGPSQSMEVSVKAKPGPASAISGPNEVTVGDEGVAYSIPVVEGAIEYDWTLNSTWDLVSGSGTNAITVDFPSSSISGNLKVVGVNECGNGVGTSMQIQVKPDAVPSIEEAGIKIFPNPNEGNFVISIPGQSFQKVSLELFDSKGVMVYTKDLVSGGDNSIKVSELNAGIYIARIKTDRGSYTSKIHIK